MNPEISITPPPKDLAGLGNAKGPAKFLTHTCYTDASELRKLSTVEPIRIMKVIKQTDEGVPDVFTTRRGEKNSSDDRLKP